jgi:hypothetical protein
METLSEVGDVILPSTETNRATRVSSSSYSVIDNIFTNNLSTKHKSAIIMADISTLDNLAPSLEGSVRDKPVAHTCICINMVKEDQLFNVESSTGGIMTFFGSL